MIDSYIGCLLAFATITVILAVWNFVVGYADGKSIKRPPKTIYRRD